MKNVRLILAAGCIVSFCSPVMAKDSATETYLHCSSDEGAFTVIISGTNGPIAVYEDKQLWNRFNKHSESDQSIDAMQILSHDGFKKRFRAIQLDRLTGNGKIAEWTDESKMGILGNTSNKRKFLKKITGQCEKIESPKLDRKF